MSRDTAARKAWVGKGGRKQEGKCVCTKYQQPSNTDDWKVPSEAIIGRAR